VRAISSSPSSSLQSGAYHPKTAPAWLLALRWRYDPLALDMLWTVFSAINLFAIFVFANWETIPFHFIWISLTLLYGFRSWPSKPTMTILAVVMLTTASGIGLDVWRGSEPFQELTEVPLMAAVFVVTFWHSRRKLAAEQRTRLFSEQNAQLLAAQRQFLQDAAHQLRTPITIALGHAELLASAMEGPQESEDIEVVIGELDRLRRISERLLVIAAAGDPSFLHPEPVSLHLLVSDLVRRWRPTAARNWRIARLDPVIVQADRERLGLALDALLENAVRHTGDDGGIQLSVIRDYPGLPARIVVADNGHGIPADQLPYVFDRFRTISDGQQGGTGLGLPLVQAVARAHGGDVTVRSTRGKGSEFELTLPLPDRPALPAAQADRTLADRTGADRTGVSGPAALIADEQGSPAR
jgi:signal transduction histidine kinase